MIQKTSKGKYYFNDKEITREEYETIAEIIRNKPVREGYEYELLDDLTWEERKIEIDPDPDIDEAEAFDIIFGGDGA